MISKAEPSISPPQTVADGSPSSGHMRRPGCQIGLSIAFNLLLIAVIYLTLAASFTLWDRDEPRFARAAVEMVESGDYLVPRFNGQLRPDKPAMVYWLMAGPLHLLGESTLAVRLPSIVGMLTTCMLTLLIGRRMFGWQAGARAMLFMGTTMITLFIGTAATADGSLMAFIMLCLWVFVERVYGHGRWHHWLVLAVALGAAQLTKGPVGLAVVVMTMSVGAVLLRRRAQAMLASQTGNDGGGDRAGDTEREAARIVAERFGRGYWVGLACCVAASLAIFLAWGIPANLATDGQLASIGLGRHVVQRMVEPAEGHGLSGFFGYLLALPAYVPLLIAGFFPWILHLPGGVSALIRKHVGGPTERAILWAWILPTFVLMTLVSTKLPHYVLPIYPALSILCAGTLQAHARKRLSEPDRAWLRGGVWFAGAMGLIIGGGLLIAPAVAGLDTMIAPAAGVGVLLLVFIGVACWLQLREQVSQSTIWVKVGLMLVLALAFETLAPAVEREVKIGPQIARAVRARLANIEGGDANRVVPVYWWEFEEPSMVFYLSRPVGHPLSRPMQPTTPEAVAAWLNDPAGEPAVLIARADLLDAVSAVGVSGALDVIVSVRGPNYSSRGRREEVMAIGRKLRPAGVQEAQASGPSPTSP